MKTFMLFCVLSIFLSSFTLCAASDPDIEAFFAIPSNPREDTHFDIYVRAEDNDGIDEIKLYVDGKLEETEDCDGDDECTVYFDVYESKSGTHEYKVKVYDDDGDTETEEIDVYVYPENNNYYSYLYYSRPSLSAYASPSQPRTGQSFSIIATATDSDGMSKIELWHGGSKIGTQNCGSTTSCSRTFTVSPKYTPSTYNFDVKAYDRRSYSAQQTLSVYIGGQSANYCGDNSCNSGESCSSCPQDCGSCNTPNLYCGDRICSNSESCSTCPTDCGACQIRQLPVLYTCAQLGGECCSNGGSGSISDAADCPSTCFAQCTKTSSKSTKSSTSGATGGVVAPTGLAASAELTLIVFGILFIVMLMLVYVSLKVKNL